MIKNCKAKGARAEHRSMSILEANGYRGCRSAASLGCWDVVGIGTTYFCLVQTKCNDWPSLLEMELLRNFPTPPNCRKLIHRFRDGVRTPDIKELR